MRFIPGPRGIVPAVGIAWLGHLVVASSFPLRLKLQPTPMHRPNGEDEPRCVDCAIIGGGPAGLAASIAVSKSSPSSTVAVFERDSFEPKGASIQISKPGWESLEELDGDGALVKELRKTSVPVKSVSIKSWKGGGGEMDGVDEQRRTKGLRERLKSTSSKVLKPVMNLLFRTVVNRQGVHLWHDVRIVLAKRAIGIYDSNRSARGHDRDTLIHANCTLVNIRPLEPGHGEDDGSRFELTFKHSSGSDEEDSFRVRAKVLLACDGTMSRVRSLLPDEPDVLLSENKSVWRGMARNYDSRGEATFYRGAAGDDTAGRSALIFPGGRGAGSSWTVISDVEDGRSESIEEARRRVMSVLETMGTDDNPEYEKLRRVVEGSNVVIENKLHVRDFDVPWESSYDGLAYLGDAAHPVRPTGEGTALALEDARVLRRVVSSEFGGKLCAKALRRYEEERYAPVKEVSERVRARAEKFYKPEGSEQSRAASQQ